MQLFAGDDYHGKRLVLGTDGATGRGLVTLVRDGSTVISTGTTQSGANHSASGALTDSQFLIGEHFIASFILHRNTMQLLSIGQSLDVDQVAATLGSGVERHPGKTRITRLPDAVGNRDGKTVVLRRFEIRGAGSKSELHLDVDGWPVRLLTTEAGATVKLERID